MMKSPLRFAGLIIVAGLPLFLGCGSGGEKTVVVRGKVHRKGELLQLTSKVPGGSQIDVGFYPVTDGKDLKDPKIVKVDPATGTFDLGAGGGKGILPGKYKITVQQFDPRPDDKLKGAFSQEKTPIVMDISADQEIDIDLAKYEKK